MDEMANGGAGVGEAGFPHGFDLAGAEVVAELVSHVGCFAFLQGLDHQEIKGTKRNTHPDAKLPFFLFVIFSSSHFLNIPDHCAVGSNTTTEQSLRRHSSIIT